MQVLRSSWTPKSGSSTGGLTLTGLKAFLDDCGNVNPLPEIAVAYRDKNLVICGDAIGVWDDLEAFGCRSNKGRGSVAKSGWDFMTVNKMVEVFPGHIEHCYSNSAATLNRFIAARRDEYAREFIAPRHSHSISEGCNWLWPFGGHGTSGLGACLVAVGLGYKRIVVCGIPLDDGPHNGEPYWRKCAFQSSEAAGGQRKDENPHWIRARDIAFENKVKSMSGRTKAWLGDAAEWA